MDAGVDVDRVAVGVVAVRPVCSMVRKLSTMADRKGIVL